MWEWEDDLLYALPARTYVKCMRAECLKSASSACARCGAKFCSRECQVKDWKVHKRMCSQLKAVYAGLSREQKHQTVLNVIAKVRMYAFPFYVHQNHKGILFLQSSNELVDFFCEPNVNRFGETIHRSLVVSFITRREFEDDIDDFELVFARAAVRRSLARVDEHHAVLLLRFRCGYVAVLVAPIVPDLGICRALAGDYEGKPQLQLNIDDE